MVAGAAAVAALPVIPAQKCSARSCVVTCCIGPNRWTGLRNFQSRTSLRSTAWREASTSTARLRSGSARAEILVQKVSATELNDILFNERTQPLVVDFYATWCGPCIFLAQDLEMLAVQYGHNVRFLKVDTDEEYELAHRMQVRGLPTMFFLSQDPEKPAIRTEGLMPLQVYKDIIEKELSAEPL